MGKHNTMYHNHHSCNHCLHFCKPCNETYCCNCHEVWGKTNTYYPWTWTTIGTPYTITCDNTANVLVSDTTTGSTSGTNTFTFHSSADHKHTN